MRIMLTVEAEAERVKHVAQLRSTKSWEFLRTYSLVEALYYAKDHGWYQKKVQVRVDGEEYYVEPFERDCTCPNILRYLDYFDAPSDEPSDD